MLLGRYPFKVAKYTNENFKKFCGNRMEFWKESGKRKEDKIKKGFKDIIQ